MPTERTRATPEAELDLDALKDAIRARAAHRQWAPPALADSSPPLTAPASEPPALLPFREEPGAIVRLIQVRSRLQRFTSHLLLAEQWSRNVLKPLPAPRGLWHRAQLFVRKAFRFFLRKELGQAQIQVNQAILDCLYDLHRQVQELSLVASAKPRARVAVAEAEADSEAGADVARPAVEAQP